MVWEVLGCGVWRYRDLPYICMVLKVDAMRTDARSLACRIGEQLEGAHLRLNACGVARNRDVFQTR